MSDLFGNYKRPRAEKKVIEKFDKKYQKAMNLYKSKNYIDSLIEFNSAYELLLNIWDIYPKIVTLNTMMKAYFYTRQYQYCKNIIDILEPLLEYIPKNKFELFIKIKAKIMIYQLILYFIYNDLDSSFEAVIDMIKYLSNNTIFTLEEKAKFFWNYIKGFLKITGITKGNKFRILKEGFDSMIVEQIMLNDDEQNNKKENSAPSKKINRNMIEIYKNFMNSKLRSIIYEVLDKEFFEIKYHKKNDKVMVFLHKNMSIFIRDNNKEKLMEIFHTFIILNKMNLEKEYNMTLNQLVFEQKRRIEMFDKIFSNLVGSFNHIFKQDFAMTLPNITKNIKKNILAKKSFRFNIQELKDMIKVQINSPSKWRKKKPPQEEKEDNEIKFTENINNMRKISIDQGDQTLINEIEIPPNTEEMDKQILLDNYITRKNLLNNFLNQRKTSINNFKYKTLQVETNPNKNKPIKIGRNPSGLKLPNITKMGNEEEEKNFEKKLYLKRQKSKLSRKLKAQRNETENESITKKIQHVFKLRNINNYLLTKILNIFTTFYNTEHDIQLEENQEIVHIHIRKKDLYDFNHPNLIKSYYAISEKGSQLENQDDYFFYNNYFLIKNLFFFGVLDGHGKNGKEISSSISKLFPTYLFYLLLDDNLCSRKMDINKEIYKLIKLQEPPANIKHMFILRYFFDKFELDFNLLPFLSYNEAAFNYLILESIYYSQNALNSKYEIDISASGTTLCSGFILGNILHLINIGDSRVILGTYYSSINKWKTKQLTVDHRPNNPEENKRIIAYNGRIDRAKNDFGEEVGPYRIFGKDSDTGQGLTMSRSIGDMESKKYGVIYDPELFRYELKENDKVIVIATDGLWDKLTNEEVIDIIADCLNKDLKAKETAEILIEKAKEKYHEEYEYKHKKHNKKNIYQGNYFLKSYKKEKSNFSNKHIHIDDITCIVIFLDINI